jgi:heme/copper-type cytochrome/quinol oxidase subunit 2
MLLPGEIRDENDMTKLRATIYLSMALLFLLAMTVPDVRAHMLAAQPSTDDNALELLVIELFFLLVGLVVLAILVYLLWQSRRNKKKAKEKGK